MIRTLLVDDENLIRQTLALYLESADIKIIGSANNGKEAIALTAELNPDVILLDIEMPEMDGLTTAQVLKRRFPQAKIIILSSHDRSDCLNQALAAGAMGYLLKSISPEALSQSIRLVNQGYLQLAPGLGNKLSLTPQINSKLAEATPISEACSSNLSLIKPADDSTIATNNTVSDRLLNYDYQSIPLNAELTLIEPDEFLPSVSRWTSRGAMVLLGIFGTACFLANIIEYKTTVKAGVRVRPAGELRLVQAATEGIITGIKVKANQTINQGDVIAAIDPSRLQTEARQLQQQLEQSKAQLTQTQAQIIDIDRQIEGETAVLEVNAQTELEVATAAVNLARDELTRFKQLIQAGAVSQLQISQKQAALQEAIAQQKQAAAMLKPTQANITSPSQDTIQSQAIGQAKINALNRERKTLVERQIDLNQQLNSDRSELQQLHRELKQTTVRATASGTIQELNLRNTGQVVNSGEAIATIMPRNSTPVLMAKVATQDIGSVEVNQKVQIKVSACPYPDYGILSGVVQTISPDAVASELPDSSNSYQVTIKPKQNFLGTAKHQCRIKPGMSGNANIITHQETVFGFLKRKARLTIGI